MDNGVLKCFRTQDKSVVKMVTIIYTSICSLLYQAVLDFYHHQVDPAPLTLNLVWICFFIMT